MRAGCIFHSDLPNSSLKLLECVVCGHPKEQKLLNSRNSQLSVSHFLASQEMRHKKQHLSNLRH